MRALWRLTGYLRPYLGQMLLAAGLLALSGALMAGIISVVKPLVNEVFLGAVAPATTPAPSGFDISAAVERLLPAGSRETWDRWTRDRAFVEVPLLLIFVFFLRGVLLYYGQYLTIRAGVRVIRDVRVELFDSVAHQSQTFFRAHPSGLILSRIVNDVARLQQASTTVLADLIRVGSMVPFLILIAFLHEWRMSLLAIVALPLLGYPMVRLGRRLRRAATASQTHMAAVASRLNESIGGVKVIQGFAMEPYEVARFRDAVQAMLRSDLRAARARALSPAVMELVGAVVGAGLFFVAGLFIARGSLDAGNFAVVLFCLGMLFMSVRRINGLYAELQRAQAAAVSVFAMMDERRQVREAADAVDLPPFSQEIRFEHISFRYESDVVLRGIDLTLRRGERVALVGASGSGKTTLANLLPRFYDPTEGRVSIDGVDLRQLRLGSLRGQIGLVTQETVLFDDTVRNNIAYGRADDTPLDRIVEAARASQAHAFIERLPEGYDTRVGEGGSRLSMGQRQRLTVARALLKDPPILILDEATSALDAESEALLQEALDVLLRGRTSLVIAHRLSTIREADRIVVLEAGRIVEQGTHDELLARGEVYARLYELQFGNTA